MITQYFDNRVKFTLFCKNENKEVEISTDPKGWDTDSIEFIRNEDYHGIFTNLSNSLQFVEDARLQINLWRKLYGVKAEIILSQFIKHPQTDEWTKRYWGYLDMSTWSDQNRSVSLKYNSGGLEQELKARDNDEFELERTTTVNGTTIEPLEIQQVRYEGRRIFLISKWEAELDFGTTGLELSVNSDAGNTRSETKGFPLKLVSKSHEQAQSVIQGISASDDNGTTGIMILADFDRTREIRLVGENIGLTTKVVRSQYDWAKFMICLTVFENGTNYDLKQRIPLIHVGENSTSMPNFMTLDNAAFNFSFDQTITVEKGDSVSLELFLEADLNSLPDATTQINLLSFSGTVYAKEDSFFEPTTGKFIFFYDTFERLTKIITDGKNKFKSNFFGRIEKGYSNNNPFSFVGLTHGFWIRGFDKNDPNTEIEPNLYKPIKTSFIDALESAQAMFKVGLGIETIENKEYLVIEDKKYFFKPLVTIKLPNQVKNVKRSEADAYYYSSIECGYEKGGTYEEAQGLDEPNALSKFTTTISRVKSLYTATSKYRADKYAHEFARRKPKSEFPSTDTVYDTDIHVLDLKKGSDSVYLERKWFDDFEELPTGIFSPETAGNLRLSPINNLLRHGWTIASGLIKYPFDYILFTSSSGNSNLKTKQINRPLYAENGKILNSELQRPLFENEWIEFEHECTFDILQQVQGYTIVNGEKVMNYYGLVEIINEEQETETGFLFNLKPNGEGKWKLLKYNNNIN